MKKLLYIPLLVLLFAACKGDPIFYSLENEEKIVDSNNFKDTTPVNRIILFNDAGQDYYVTHGKQLWYSVAGTEQSPWYIVPKPDGYGTTSVVSSIAVYNSRVYVTLIDEDNNSKSGLYYITAVDGSLKKVFEYDRRDAEDNDYYFYTFSLFPADDGNLYIARVDRKWNTLTSDSATVVGTEIYHFDTALNEGSSIESGTEVTLPGLSSSTYIVRSITNTGADTNEVYLAVNEVGSGIDYYAAGKLFVANTATNYTDFTEDNPGESSSFNKIFYSDNLDILLLSTRESGRNHSILYKLNTAGTFGSWVTNLEGDEDVQFSAFADISEMTGVGDIILLGTRADVIDDSQTYYNGSGYFELNLANRTSPVIQSNTFALDTNYNSTDLKNATIMSFLVHLDTGIEKIYTSTSSYGLWLNHIDSDGNRKWYQE
jgi:hypothetical protein